MKDYSKMSDFEVNKAVLASLCAYVDVDIVQHPHHADGVSVGLYRACGDYYEWFDYCNNPSDAWPIMDEHKIGLTFVNGEWRASSVKAGYHEFSDAKAFRAAMIVYLMMMDVE